MNNEWESNKLFGNIGEKIVEYIFSSNGWNCIKYGMESHIEELRKTLKDNNTVIAKKIRSMPDFVIINEKTGELFIIDAKYRSWIGRTNPKETIYGFRKDQIKNYRTFWKEAKLIIINNYKPYFIVVNVADIKDKFLRGEFYNPQLGQKFERWNFKEIEKGIKEVFPNLSDEAINNAVRLIPGRKKE